MASVRSAVQEIVTRDTERTEYDLSSWSMQCGALGSLTALKCMPVVAGDSIELDINSVIRLSPLRRQMYLDSLVDLFAFYIPHRHIYGSDWISYVKSGFDESVSLGVDTQPAVDAQCWGIKVNPSASVPRWISRGMVQIFNRYFRDPSYAAGELAEDYFPNLSVASAHWNWGLPACHTKQLITATNDTTLSTADYRLALESSEVNLLSLDALKGRLQSEVSRDWFGLRYRDIVNHTWGTTPNTDADQMPTLLGHSKNWLSGMDIAGTDDSTLGSWTSKSQGLFNLRVPYRFIPEHGAIWIMALVRFPYVHANETHYLATKAQPTYAEICGDPAVISRMAPVTLNANEVLIGSGSVDLGEIPHSQWYRTSPNFVNGFYSVVAGHPFLTTNPSSRQDAIYIEHDDYDQSFQTYQLKHWNAQTHVGVTVRSFVPPPTRSIFAGVGQ